MDHWVHLNFVAGEHLNITNTQEDIFRVIAKLLGNLFLLQFVCLWFFVIQNIVASFIFNFPNTTDVSS